MKQSEKIKANNEALVKAQTALLDNLETLSQFIARGELLKANQGIELAILKGQKMFVEADKAEQMQEKGMDPEQLTGCCNCNRSAMKKEIVDGYCPHCQNRKCSLCDWNPVGTQPGHLCTGCKKSIEEINSII